MNDLPALLFEDPVWHALKTKHAHLGTFAPEACRYLAEVAPFAAVRQASNDALQQLRSLLVPGEEVWLIGTNYPAITELAFAGTLECLQMLLPEEVAAQGPEDGIVQLSRANAEEMVALTDIAFPGFFRRRTCEMGSYYGVRENGELIAMGGERLTLEGYCEVSGVCTHPDHRGKGLAAKLIRRLVRKHRREGVVSFLHVTATNRPAVELYRRIGFEVVRNVILQRISRRL